MIDLASSLIASNFLGPRFTIESDGRWPEGTAEQWETLLTAVEARQSREAFEEVGFILASNGDLHWFAPRKPDEEVDYLVVLAANIDAWVVHARATIALGKQMFSKESYKKCVEIQKR